MSFRDNLQHLRAERNMTQEQLAMLLGVSRQSVTKWEAEKSQPEMDKLLKMCQIFECSLDDLVTGDLTTRAAPGAPNGPAPLQVPDGPPTDICGYDEHRRTFARKVSLGVFLILFGVATAALVDELLAPLGVHDSLSGGLTAIILFGAIAIALALFIPSGMEHAAFNRAHPYVEDFYTPAQKAEERRLLARRLVAGTGLILVGMCIPAITDGMQTANAPFESIAAASFLYCVAVSAWLFVYGGMMYARVNLVERNKSVLEELEVEELAEAQVDEATRAALVEAKTGPQGRKQKVIGGACGIIMLTATAISLIWLFMAATADGTPVNDVDWSTFAKTVPFWIPWVVGALCCGITSIAIETFWRED